MALNPLNMQASVPRSGEIGQMQQHAMHKQIADQDDLSKLVQKHSDEARTQTQKMDETEKKLKYDERNSQQDAHYQQQKKRKKQQQENSEEKTIHPYKGHSIDIKL